MTGPRDIIRQAAMQRTTRIEPPAQRIPAPMPIQPTPIQPVSPARTPENKPRLERQSSPVTNWRMPPLTPEQKSGVGQEGFRQHPPETSARPVPEETEAQGESYRLVPQNIGGHAIYRDLMRSHDRMGTRHIPPRG